MALLPNVLSAELQVRIYSSAYTSASVFSPCPLLMLGAEFQNLN
ncbi:hypothetical protein FDUTEX481_08400 [Tolypothrix sp. PCC 7601]|nr:hypothetical protein FDUTEX481_08400 [Tolypothrix sp. PCC 7601]